MTIVRREELATTLGVAETSQVNNLPDNPTGYLAEVVRDTGQLLDCDLDNPIRTVELRLAHAQFGPARDAITKSARRHAPPDATLCNSQRFT